MCPATALPPSTSPEEGAGPLLQGVDALARLGWYGSMSFLLSRPPLSTDDAQLWLALLPLVERIATSGHASSEDLQRLAAEFVGGAGPSAAAPGQGGGEDSAVTCQLTQVFHCLRIHALVFCRMLCVASEWRHLHAELIASTHALCPAGGDAALQCRAGRVHGGGTMPSSAGRSAAGRLDSAAPGECSVAFAHMHAHAPTPCAAEVSCQGRCTVQ